MDSLGLVIASYFGAIVLSFEAFRDLKKSTTKENFFLEIKKSRRQILNVSKKILKNIYIRLGFIVFWYFAGFFFTQQIGSDRWIILLAIEVPILVLDLARLLILRRDELWKVRLFCIFVYMDLFVVAVCTTLYFSRCSPAMFC